MALWKPFRGNRADLDMVEKHDGYVYFCTDDGSLFFDYTDADGNLHRKQINAKDAETLLGHSIEEFLIASENGSFAHGEGSAATGNNSYAGGQETLAKGWHSHAEGHLTQAIGYGAHAENGQTKAIGGYSHAEGYLSKAEGSQSHSEGQSTQAIGNNSHAEGQDTQAIGNASHAEGLLTVASGANSHAEGLQTQALSIATSATGLLTKAGGKAFKVVQRMEIPTEWGVMSGYTLSSMTGIQAALAEATSNGQSLYYAVHMADTDYYELGVVGDATSYPNTLIGGGYSNIYPMTDLEKTLIPSSGSYLLIAGYPQLGEIEIGAYATAEGVGSCAQHYASHAEGVNTYAIGPGAHAEGVVAHAVHIGSHAEGYHTVAGGAHSHAGGSESEAGGENAFAHGEKLYAYEKNQFVVGQYNKEDPDALFIVGGGDGEEDRKNLFTVKKDGSITGLNTSNALTKTVSGEAIAIADASPIEHEMDVKVRGKNLFNLSNAYVTSGGEMTINGTTIALTRKATGNPPSIIFELGAYKNFVGKTLTISFVLDAMGSSGDTNASAAMNIHCGNTAKEAVESVSGFTYTSGRVGETITKTFTVPALDDKDRQLCIRHYMNNGKTEGDYITISNFQIEEGTTATAYTPYIEDISTVKVKKYGKNLFEATTSREHRGITFELLDDGTYHVYGTNDGTGHSAIEVETVLPTGKYTGSGCPSGGSQTTYHIKFSNLATNKSSVDYGDGKEFETTATQRIIVQLMVRSGQTVDLIFKPMIEVGTGDKVYAPYIEPIEYPVSADGTVEGVTPTYPTTTLMTDTAGVVMDCTYNRDINRVLDDTGFMYDHNPSGTGSFSMNRKAGSEIGEYSHAEGYSSAAIGKASHAGGEATQAKSVGSFAHGQRVTADADYQATFGTHNEVNANAAFIVGNGANSTSKNNAFEVQKDGNAFVKGDLYIGGTGNTQASAKQVATKDSISAMEQRINNLEDITSSTGGVFFEDADVAYVKTIPENIAPYASLNKVGGMGIYQKKLVNLIPSTYDADSGSVYDYHTFNSDAEGVITIIDRTPVEEWTYEPWFYGEIPLNTIELPAGTYTAAIYADNPEGSPFGLNIYGPSSDIDLRVGGAWGYDYAESPVTFVLTETTSLDLFLKFDCGGSAWVPTGDTEVCHFRVMLNEGEEAMPWEPYSGAEVKYIEPAKTTSVDIIGKNLFDYGTSRTIHTGEPGYTETNMMITDKGTAYIENLYIPVEVGPGSEYGTIMSAWIDDVNSTITYPAGVYSVGDPVPHTNGEVYLVIHAKTINTQQNITIQGNNNVIAEPFTIRSASIDYAPAELTSGIYGIEVPLMLVKGTQTPAEPLPFKRSTIQIPSQIVSREDYGLGVYDTYNYELYNNYIDFERQKYIKRCLTQDLVSEVTGFGTHGTKINPGVMYSTIRCSDPDITFDFYQPGPGAYELHAYKEGWDSVMVEEYIQNAMESGTPIKVFFGTNLTEEIDISAELTGIDNYIPVEAGGLIYFNNDRQEAVPSTIEYQSMMKKGEIEEL